MNVNVKNLNKIIEQLKEIRDLLKEIQDLSGSINLPVLPNTQTVPIYPYTAPAQPEWTPYIPQQPTTTTPTWKKPPEIWC